MRTRTATATATGTVRRLAVGSMVAAAALLTAVGCSDDAAENPGIGDVRDTEAPVDPTVEPAD
ncbi:hypothetical protein [Blastococcus montanus]|uniref:hypothetical protein n=1 Tax=Blastococcus montanus TaxID=3144973 RepID=UPI00320ADF48